MAKELKSLGGEKAEEEPMQVIGFYHPHKPVNWTGEILDPKTGEFVKEASMTKQSFKEECDINNIVKRFEATGILEHLNMRTREGMYVDLPDPLDFQESLEIVRQAESAFMSLPADLRARFGNDPEQFLAFTNDPANQEEMIKLGLATDTRPGPEPAPLRVEVVPPPKPPEPPKTGS